jgi:prepilin-type N-terminal cleavage/methylation domain-containing protein
MKTTRRHRSSGFTLIEVSVATVLIVLVATSAILSLQIGLRTITGTEAAADAAAAIREFREFTIGETIEETDARDGQQFAPVLASGEPMAGADDLTLDVEVTPVSDLDPETPVAANASRTRLVTVSAVVDGRPTMEANWIVAEH